MTAIIDGDHKVIDCPHCKGKMEIEIERKPAKVTIDEKLPIDIDLLAEKIMEKTKSDAPAKVEKEYPGFMPGEYCPDGNCSVGGVHKNNGYRVKPEKQCKNCSQLAPGAAKKCAWCGDNDFEKVTDAELSDVGIRLPSEEHSHEH